MKWKLINRDKAAEIESEFDIELLDRILGILMGLEMTTKTRYLAALVLLSPALAPHKPEFEKSLEVEVE